jgi:DNA polymerase III subunit beta
MKFTLVQSELYRSLQLVASVVPSKTAAQNLTSVRIEATADGKLSFTGTDLDTFLVTYLHGTVEQAGVATIPARRFLEVVKELPADVVQLQSTASGLTLTCGKGKFRLVGPDPEEFPAPPEISEEKVFAVPAEVLDRLIRQTAYAVSTDYTRAELTAVYVHVVDGELRFVATNGHRLARASHRGDYPTWGNILVPPKALLTLQRLLPEAQESISMTTSRRYCLFNLGTSRLYTRLLDGSFPEYEQVIPQGNEKKALVQKDVFSSALRRVAVFSESTTKQVKVSLENGLLRLSVQTQNVGDAEESIPAKYSGEAFHIGYNAAYLLELLRTMESEELQMAFQEPATAGVFTPVGTDGTSDLLCLVMPLRLQEETVETGVSS